MIKRNWLNRFGTWRFSGMIKIENDLFDEWLMVGQMGMTQPFLGLVLESYDYNFSYDLATLDVGLRVRLGPWYAPCNDIHSHT